MYLMFNAPFEVLSIRQLGYALQSLKSHKQNVFIFVPIVHVKAKQIEIQSYALNCVMVFLINVIFKLREVIFEMLTDVIYIFSKEIFIYFQFSIYIDLILLFYIFLFIQTELLRHNHV